MKIIEIKEILKKDIPLSYRNDYTGTLVYNMFDKEEFEENIEFSIEHSALGDLTIKVELSESFNYPLLPAVSQIKDYISSIEKKGILR